MLHLSLDCINLTRQMASEYIRIPELVIWPRWRSDPHLALLPESSSGHPAESLRSPRKNHSMERRWKTHLFECSTDRRQELAELLVVEGDSAARAVLAVRDPVHQSVMAMQGKPRNAYKCSEQQVRSHPLLSQLLVAIAGAVDSAPPPAHSALQYRRVVLLMDPDADGVHAGMLLLLFFHRMIPALLQGDRLEVAIPPILYWEEEGTWTGFCSNEQHADEVKRRSEAGLPVPPRTPVRGLASLPRALLLDSCVAKATRQSRSLSSADAAAAMRLLVPKIESVD